MRKKMYTRPLLLFLCLLIGLTGLPLKPVQAAPLLPTLVVEATSINPGERADYNLRFKPNMQQSDSFAVSLKIPAEYTITTYPEFMQATVGGVEYSNITYTPSYEGLYHYLDFLVPSSIGLDEEVIIPLSSFEIVNPWSPGAYTFIAQEPGSADQAEGTITIGEPAAPPPPFESEPPQLFTGGSNSLHFNLNTAPLVDGDYIQFDFPDNFVLNFDESNHIPGTSESAAIWLQVNGDNSGTPNIVILPGNTIQIPIYYYWSGSQYQIDFEKFAVTNPGVPSSGSVFITTSKDTSSIEVPLTVVTNPLQYVTSSKKQYAIDVEHQFTFTPHAAIDDAHPLEIAWPDDYTAEYLTAFDPNQVRIFFESGGITSELPAESIEYGYGYWRISPNGQTYGTDNPLTVRITGMNNPVEIGSFTIGLRTYGDSYSFYTDSVIEAASPSRNPEKYQHFLNISPGSYLTLPSMPGVNEFAGTSNFAVNMWIKPQTLSGIQMLYEKKAAADNELDFKLYLEEGKLTASLNKGSDPSTARVAVSPLPIEVNNWNQIAASIYWGSYGELELIVNGESDYETIRELDTDLTIAGASHTQVTVGASTDGVQPFTGSIDDLQVWNDFLTASQVRHFMYWGLDLAYMEDTLKSYYPFEAYSVLEDHMSGNEAIYAGAPVGAFSLEPGESFDGSMSLADGLTVAAVEHTGAKGQIYMADSETGTYTYTAYPYEQGTDHLIFAVISQDMGMTLSSLEATIGVTAELKSIIVDQVELNTHHGQFHYEVELPHDRTYVKIGAYGYPGQTRTLTVNGNTEGSDLITNEVGMDVDLSEGMNTAEIQVLSSDASITNTYTLGIRVRSAAEEPLWNALQSITEEDLLGENTNAYDIRSNLVLPSALEGGAALSWASIKPDVIGHDGVVNIPTGSGETVYFTVTAEKDGIVYHYPVPYVFYVPGLGNTPPTVYSQSLHTAHEQPLSGIFTGVDLEGQTLQFSITSEPSNGTIVLSGSSNGSFTYTPAPGFFGEDRFYFQAFDGEDYSLPTEVIVHVYGPYSSDATPESFTINSQEIPVIAGQNQYHFSVPSVQNGLYIYANGKTGQNLRIEGSHGNYKYLELGSEDPVTLQVETVSEDGLASNTYTFVIERVTEPEMILSSIVPEMFLGHGDTVNSVVNDLYLDLSWLELPTGSTHTWESSDPTVISNTGVVMRSSNGPRDVTFTLELTMDGVSAAKSFNLTVPQNHVPAAESMSFHFDVDTVEGHVSAIDQDPDDGLTFSLVSAPPSSDGTLEFDSHTGWFRFTRANTGVTAASFTFTATDGDAVSNPAAITLSVAQAEQILASMEPEALLGYGDTVSNVVQDLLLDLSSLELPEGSTYTWESSAPTVISNNGVVTRPTDGPRDVSLTLELTIDGISASKSFTLTVPQNHAPIANEQSISFTGDTVEGYVSASDTDPGDILTYSLEQTPPSSDGTLEFDSHTGWFRFTRANTDVTAASFTFTFTATDGDAVSNPASITLTVAQAEQILASMEPEALLEYGDTVSSVVQDLLLDLSWLELPEGSTYTWESSAPTVISNNGVVTRPTDGPRDVSLTLELTIDGFSASKSYTLTVPQNHVPVANEQSLTFTGNTVEGYVTASDNDAGDTLTYNLEQAPPSSDGTLEFDSHTGWFRFTRANTGVTATSFTFTATDSDAISSPAAITMTEIVTVPAVLTALYVGGSPDSLSPIALTDGEFYYDSTITVSTTIYVKPVADARALITVNNTSISATSTTPVAIPAMDYHVNPVIITVSSPTSPTAVTTYTLGVQVDSGLADVTGITSSDGTEGSVTGQELTLTGLPAGTYNAQLTVSLADPGAVVSQARLINTETALTVHSPATIEVPLSGVPVYVVFTVQDRNGATKLYTLGVTQGEAPPPPPPAEPVLGLAMVDWDGTGMTIGFDLPLLTADLSKLRYVIGNTTYELSSAAASYSVKANSLEIKLKSPILAGTNPTITLQADQGAVTSVNGGKSKAASAPIVLLNPGGTQNDDAYWDVKDLFQVMNSNPEALTPEIIHIVINRVTPRFLTITSQ